MWQLLGIIGIIFFILEIFSPAMFFLNLAFASFLTAIVSLFTNEMNIIILSFVIFSALTLFILRPILMNLKTDKSQQTGINNKYIGKTVKTVSEITADSGVITVYGERWEARSQNGETIEADTNVRIVRNESLIMFVEKV